jgi:hypothetical protein
MSYVTAEARQALLDELAAVIDHLGVALAALGDAYEQLDERSADRLEEELFGPVQRAYGRAQRTHAAFAERHGLPGRTFAPAAHGVPSTGVRGFLERAVEAVADAEDTLVELQDSMMPVEVGDPELRAGLAEVRTLTAELTGAAREFVRVLGR